MLSLLKGSARLLTVRSAARTLVLPVSAQGKGRPGAEGRGPTVTPRAVRERCLVSAFTASVSGGDCGGFFDSCVFTEVSL